MLFPRYGNSTGLYKVRVGDYHSLVPEEYEEEYAVEKIVLHPRYRADSNDYDLALVRVSGHRAHRGVTGDCVTLSRFVLPACLPMRREKVPKGIANCYITGWGDTGWKCHETHAYTFMHSHTLHTNFFKTKDMQI